MTSYLKTSTNRYLFEQLKIVRLLFVSVMHSTSIGIPFEWLGLSIPKHIQQFEQLPLSDRKKNPPLKRAEVFNLELKTFQPFKQQRFSTRQRESNQSQLFVEL